MRFIPVSIFLAVTTIAQLTAYAQYDATKAKCSDQDLGTTFISKEYPGKEAVVQANWNDYFGTDLTNDLPYKGTNKIISIKLDAHGCVYPPFADIIDKNDFLNDGLCVKDFRRLSFFQLFSKDVVAKKIFDRMKGTYRDGLIDSVKDLARLAHFHKNPDTLIHLEYEFRRRWNDLFMGAKVKEINSLMHESNTDQVFFFVGGFNVPYSLQHIQSNYLFRKIEDTNIAPGKIVFVRLFWPSESEKDFQFSGGTSRYRDNRTLKTAKKNKMVANRSYMAGVTVKDLMNKIEANKVNMLSHSHGAVVITASLISPISKIGNPKKPINRALLAEYKIKPKEGLRVRAFLSAPGIPGRSTFARLDPEAGRNYKFFVGYNQRDDVQLKWFFWILPPSPRKHSSTSLGCNWLGEVKRTRKVFEKKQIGDNFVAKRSGRQPTHDIFCYTTKQQFNDLFKEFLVSCYQ